MIDLTGKTAVVTGGSSGIGQGICIVLAEQGANIAVADIDEPGALAVSEHIIKIGRESVFLDIDVTSRASVDQGVKTFFNKFDRLDILVNNAGVVGADGWWDRRVPSDQDWDTVFDINLMGVVHMTQAVESHMKEQHYGKIINIASIAARRGGANIPHYNASKAAVMSWTQSNALQLAEYGINVNAICPGLLWTPLFEHLIDRPGYTVDENLSGLSGRDRFNKTVEIMIPMKREQTPEDIGKMAAFLASDDASSITGQSINVDGGRFMN